MAGDQTVVQVAADTTGYVAAMIRAQKSAADFVTSQDRVKSYTENAVRAIDGSRQALAAQGGAAVDAFNKSAKGAEKFLVSLQKQADQAGKTQAEMLRLRAAEYGVSDAAKAYIDQIEKANTATGHLQHGAAGARKEMLVLAHEAATGSWSNFGGSLMVLGERLDFMKYLMNPVVLGIGAMAAAAYVAYEAIHKLSEQQKAINDAMALTANYADLTQGKLLVFSDAISKDLGVSTGTASDALMAMAKSGMVAGSDLKDVSESIVAYSKTSGDSVSDVAKMFEQSYGNAASAAKKWAETHHDLTQSQLDNIKVMEQSGDKAGAWKEFVIDASAAARKQVLADNDAMGSSYETLGQAWDRFWRGVTGKGDQLTKLHDQLAALESQKNDPDQNPFGANTDEINQQEAAIRSQIDSILKASQAQDAQNKALDTFSSMNQQHIEDMKKTWTWQQKLNDANETARKKIEALSKAAQAQGPVSPQYQAKLQADLNSMLAANAREYHAPKTDSGYHEPRGTSLLDEARAQQAVLEQSLSSNGQLTGWAAKRAALEAQIANYAGQTLTKQQASVLANKDALLAQYKTNAALEADGDFRDRVTKLQAAQDQLNERIQNQNDALAAQQQIELQTATLTTQERQRQIALLAIETERRKELADWAKTAEAQKLTGSDTDLAEQRTINQKYAARATTQQQTFAAQDLLKSDWAAGATTGLKQIIEQTSNLNQIAQSTVTDGIRGIGDAFAELATTGKLNMGDLAKSIVADFARMEAEALAAQAAMSFMSWAGIGSSATTGATSYAGAFHLASGGHVRGPGSSTSDSIPAMLSDGEYVLNAAAVSRIGVSHLDDLNSGAARAVNSVARYASGGAVGSVASTVGPASSGGGSPTFNITVNGSGANSVSSADMAELQKLLDGWWEKKFTQRVKGQGGLAWQQKYGSV